ncbi:hypothetical protein EC900091_2545, partial [Escherichia coli 90.0091]
MFFTILWVFGCFLSFFRWLYFF